MLAAAGAACALALGPPAASSAGKQAPDPERVQARGVEFDLTLSRTKLRPGRAIIQFLNAGEDPHDLRIQRLDAGGHQIGDELGFGVIGPGDYDNLDTHLARRARYVLWCSLDDHRQRGMEATLRTRRHRR